MIWLKKAKEHNYEYNTTLNIEVERPDAEAASGKTYIPYTVQVNFDIVRDNSYGADADGNRGTYMEWVEDWAIESVTDDAGNVVPVDKDIENVVENKMEDLDLSKFGDDSPDPDEFNADNSIDI